MRHTNDRGQSDIEVRVHDGENAGGTAYGTIMRKVTEGKKHLVTVGGERLIVHDPHGYAHVFVRAFPRDMNEQGYG